MSPPNSTTASPLYLTPCASAFSRIDCELEGLAAGSGSELQIDAPSVSDDKPYSSLIETYAGPPLHDRTATEFL